MASQIPSLTSEQWKFLSIFNALQGPVSMDLAGRLVPLLPGPLFDFIRKVEEKGWIKRSGADKMQIAEDLPVKIKNKLNHLNQAHLPQMIELIYAEGLEESISPQNMAHLLETAGRPQEASKIEFELVDRAMRNKDRESALTSLKKIVDRLMAQDRLAGVELLFIESVLRYSNLSYIQGRDLEKVEKYLLKAIEVADALGDRRHQALTNLHLARIFYIRGQREKAMAMLSTELEKVRQLGDKDILTRTAVFSGQYYFLQGLFPKAIDHLKQAQQTFESTYRDTFHDPNIPLTLAFCSLYMGQFHWCIGHLDYNIRMLKEYQDHAMAAVLRATMGTLLLLLNKKKRGTHSCTSPWMKPTNSKILLQSSLPEEGSL